MSEVSYSNVPPMMAAIKSGDIEAIRSLLHAGHSPNEPQCYQVMIGEWPRDGEASPLELAVLENRMDMVQLLIECGADLTHNPEELLCGSLRSQDLTLFSFLVDVGVRIPATQRDICRLFLHLVDRDEPNVLPILKRMGMDLKQYGGEALRSMASHGNQPVSYTHLDVYKRQLQDRLERSFRRKKKALSCKSSSRSCLPISLPPQRNRNRRDNYGKA